MQQDKPLIGKTIQVREGFVKVVDYMGDDSAVVQAARVSYGDGTKTKREDEGLIRYLMRNRHTTPFEMCEIKFFIKAPMDVMRQWIRHRTASVNEYSTRYSKAIDYTAVTDPTGWRLQSKTNKQGSEQTNLDLPDGIALSNKEAELHQLSREIYEDRLDRGVAREQARKDLPLSTYTELYWKMDLHNLMHFLGLRMDHHAQLEIRQYANAIGSVVAEWVPMTWKAFIDFRFDSLSLSSEEVGLIYAFANGEAENAQNLLKSMSKSDIREANKVFKKLGFKFALEKPDA